MLHDIFQLHLFKQKRWDFLTLLVAEKIMEALQVSGHCLPGSLELPKRIDSWTNCGKKVSKISLAEIYVWLSCCWLQIGWLQVLKLIPLISASSRISAYSLAFSWLIRAFKFFISLSSASAICVYCAATAAAAIVPAGKLDQLAQSVQSSRN